MQTVPKFITPTEKTLCQVHLTSKQAQGDLQLCSHTKESQVQESHSDGEGISLAHRAVRGEMKLHPDSLTRKMLRD